MQELILLELYLEYSGLEIVRRGSICREGDHVFLKPYIVKRDILCVCVCVEGYVNVQGLYRHKETRERMTIKM